ncbi:hypothetical protein [Rubrimonas cliftonensis]|nr:hypothetical protein [Rubrimonas cliftonensis]
MRSALFALVLAVAPLHAAAQSSEGLRHLLALMANDCAIGGARERFRLAAEADPAAARRLFVATLEAGPPAETLDSVRAAAAADHERLAAWAERNRDKAHARAFLADGGQGAYVTRAVRSIELVFRGNAIMGLGLVGRSDDRALVASVVSEDPRYEALARNALAAMLGR